MFNKIPDMVGFEGDSINVDLSQRFTEKELETFCFSLNVYSDSDCKNLLYTITDTMMDDKILTITAPCVYDDKDLDLYVVLVAKPKEVTENDTCETRP